MKICLYSICIACFLACTSAEAQKRQIRSPDDVQRLVASLAIKPTISTSPEKTPKSSELEAEIERLRLELSELKKSIVKKEEGPSLVTITRYRYETRQCPTCPAGVTETVRVPYEEQVKVYDPGPNGGEPGFYRTDGGERYFWNGRESFWVDENGQFFRRRPRGPFRGRVEEKIELESDGEYEYEYRYEPTSSRRRGGLATTVVLGTIDVVGCTIGTIFSILF